MLGLYCLADGLPGLVVALRASDRGTYLLQAVVSLVVGGAFLESFVEIGRKAD
jgi:hypothetical protein